ncbi:septation protein SepH [Corynebacterium callunae]|uniref:septation protein SepH n=1 Tax=Corynebacterium callunae TaxID=1721 RepID=UPI001FFE85F4|nr:septation protein SepH [Corynebacterium callunae]MCK2201413.1 septation protein SepH [Corynebacterium callunae]
MREIFLVREDSTESSLVFRSSDEDGAEEFFIAVTEDLRQVLAGHKEIPAPEPEVPVVLEAVSPKPAPREEKELDPRISAPLTMSPREIQIRVRAGASIAELAEENGVTEARIEPYAHPVLLERARIAELAKQSHPIRENGPAKLTLWEVLATAFATRGHDLTSAVWDSYKDATNQWIVRVDWKAGLSDNHAEWTLNLHNTSNPTADPRTPVAADLIDPEFIQPVRTLTSISHNDDVEDSSFDDEDIDFNDSEEHLESTEHDEDRDVEAPRNRRRKAVTPHWEDVLLGVRANTKRPKK